MSPVQTIGPPLGYSDLQTAYNAVIDNSIILAHDTVFTGDLNIDLSKPVFFEGGFDCDYTSVTGQTIIDGDMLVSAGTFTIGYGFLKIDSGYYSVGGTVFGLNGDLTLQNNGTDDIVINQDSIFTFPALLPDNSDYTVSVYSAPVDQDCYITNGTGIINDVDITNVDVVCVLKPSCIDCHSQTRGPLRAVTGPGGDFNKNSHHVNDGTNNEIVEDEDCIVCHAEEQNDGLHINGYIDLKDADNYVPATPTTGALGIYVLGDAQGQPDTYSWSDDRDLTLFCLSCHDSDGASVTYNSTGGTALNPFNDGLTNSHEPNGMDGAPPPHSRQRVVDVYSLLDPLITVSHHNVLAYRYSVWQDDSVIRGIDDRAFTGTPLINGNASEGSLLECADCHTTAQNAHGAFNARYFLKDKYGNDVIGTDNNVICFRCHEESVYYGGTPANADYSIFSTQHGRAGDHNSDYDNIFGIGCLNCHGGNNFGAIHGALDSESLNNGGTGPYYQPYRFLNGASFGYISNWNQTSVSCGAKTTSTFFSNCTNHNKDGGGQNYEREYLRNLDY